VRDGYGIHDDGRSKVGIELAIDNRDEVDKTLSKGVALTRAGRDTDTR
jgi:hypothetical protein